MTEPQDRKPRIALMGEFSAGKSTLSNILLGARPIPVQVTATTLPPVWITKGTGNPVIVDHEGDEATITIEDLAEITHREAARVHLQVDADILELCDLIDMPGVSDPNMPADIWLSMLDEIDCVIWCTHANQAWRQSEAAIWERVEPETNGQNLLLITQFDKLQTDRDRKRLLNRVKKETEGLFEAVYPVSFLPAIKAGPDYEPPEGSDIAAFVAHLVDILLHSKGAAEKSGVVWDTVPELPAGQQGKASVAPEAAPETSPEPEIPIVEDMAVDAREAEPEPYMVLATPEAYNAPEELHPNPTPEAAPATPVIPRRVAAPKVKRERPAARQDANLT